MAINKYVDPISELKERQGTRSLRDFAKDIPCSAPYLSDIYKGRREPGPLIIRFLKLKKVVKSEIYYERVV